MMIGVVRPEERVVGLSKGAFLFMVDGITTPRDNKSGTHVYSNLGLNVTELRFKELLLVLHSEFRGSGLSILFRRLASCKATKAVTSLFILPPPVSEIASFFESSDNFNIRSAFSFDSISAAFGISCSRT